MSRKLNLREQAQLRAMIARTSLEEVARCSGMVMPALPEPEPEKCNLCGEPLGFDAWVDSNGNLLAGPYDDHMCLTDGCANNR